jgi:hypothetical protein
MARSPLLLVRAGFPLVPIDSKQLDSHGASTENQHVEGGKRTA